MRAAKICPRAECSNVTPCPVHARKPWAGSSYQTGTSTLSGSQRQKRARYVLDRDDTVCGLCGYPGSTEADHRIPLAHGGADTVENLQAVHKGCHAEKTRREAQEGKR